jgi:Tat protein translocase TatB subunit
VFNFSGSEVIFLMILGLVILGPEKLPGVLRKAGRLYGEFKRVTSDAQSELRQALDQPMKEIQSTARTYQNFFVDAAKETTKDPVPPKPDPKPSSSSKESEPEFVPYEAPVSEQTERVEESSAPNTTEEVVQTDEPIERGGSIQT